LSVKKRLYGMGIPKNIKTTIIQELKFDIGFDAFIFERNIKQNFKELCYLGDSIMDNGNTELFTKNILNL